MNTIKIYTEGNSEPTEANKVLCRVSVVDLYVRLEYKVEEVYYFISFPRTSQNEHLRVGDKVFMLMALSVAKMPAREIYKRLFNTEFEWLRWLFYKYDVEYCTRQANIHAVKNTRKEWKKQWER